MVNVSFYITDVNYENREDKALVQLFGRTIDGKKICVLTDYDYSFYVIPKKNIKKVMEKVKKIVVMGKEKIDFVKNVEIIDMKYLGDDVQAIRVFISNPNAVREIAERIKDLDNVELVKETDLNFYKKYLLDNQITPLVLTDIEGEVLLDRDDLDVDFVVKAKKIKQVKEESFENPSIIAFDLEIYSPEKKYPSEKDPIIMLSMVSNDGYQKVFTWKKFKHNKKYIEFVEDEESLIHKFKEVLKEKNPDYVTGYFSDGFDFPFLQSRAKKYGIDLRFNNSHLRINKRGNSVTAKLKGIVHLDVFKFIGGIMANSLNFENYKLNTVAKELLGKKKLDVNLDELGIVWDDGSDKLLEFCEYNLIDSQLTLELCEKILPNLNELVKLTNSPIYDICRSSYSAIVDMYLMRMAKEYNEIIPNKPDQGDASLRRTHTYQGAFVYEPKPGLYGKLAVLDFRSLYPTILVVHNVCPTTLTNKKGGYESPEIVLESGEKKKYYFTSKKEGFIPRVVKEIITRRIRVNELLKKDKKNPILKARSYALKTVANATSGYLGFFGARWYCRECAESMTAWGREYITDVIEKAEKKGFEVIYGDTDSIFLVLGDKSKKDTLDFLDEINRELPSLMELELDDFYKRGLFVFRKGEKTGAKKKYALVSEEGEIKVTGFETVRGDWSVIAREVQKKVLEYILKDNDPKKAYEYVRKVIEKIKRGKEDMEKMIIKTQLKRKLEGYAVEGPHVKVARKMKAKGEYVGPGITVQYIVTPGKGNIGNRAEIPEDAKSYDADYYINNQILPVVEKIFDVLGRGKEELVGGKKQMKLGEY
ncbi:MAG: DNA-directed DNA polymerase [Nanoarchaeota archaeon]